MIEPKILVGCPASDYHAYCTDEYINGVRSLTYPLYDFLVVDNSSTDTFSSYLRSKQVSFLHDFATVQDIKQKIALSRNALRKKVLDEGYDYFLSLEQDVIPPPDAIEQLLRHKKPIVSGVYYSYYPVQGKQALFPVLYRSLTHQEQEHMQTNLPLLQKMNPSLHADLVANQFDFSAVRVKLKPEDVAESRLITVKQCGLGCVLIAREVLEKISFRVDAVKNTYDDALFCDDVRAFGYDLYVDTGVKCKHLIKKRPWTWKELDPKA